MHLAVETRYGLLAEKYGSVDSSRSLNLTATNTGKKVTEFKFRSVILFQTRISFKYYVALLPSWLWSTDLPYFQNDMFKA
jgi:hypothetical protein